MAISSAIVPYKANSSTAVVKPQQSLSGIIPAKKEESAIVPIKKEAAKKAEVTTRDIRASVLRLLRKRQQRDRLEAKFYKLQDTLAEREKASKEEAKSEKNSFLSKVGSGFKNQAKKVGGDLFGSIGKLLGFLALDWISKPENQKLVAGIVEGIGHIFKFVEWFVSGSIDNLLSGFNSLIAGDTILERVLGFFQMAAGFMGIRYFLKPHLIVTDLMNLRKFIMEGGIRKLKIFYKKIQKFGLKKGLKFAFPRVAKIIQKISSLGSRIVAGIGKKLSKTGAGNLFSKIGNAIWRLGRKLPVEKLLGPVKRLIKPVSGFLKRIPVVGTLISFGLNLLLGDSLTQAAFKGLGAGLGSWIGGGIGSLIPIPVLGTFAGVFIGGMVGEWLGNRFYEMLMKREPRQVTEAEKQKSEILKQELKLKNEMGARFNDLSQKQIDALVAEKLNITAEEVAKRREAKEGSQAENETVTETTTTTTTTTGGASGPPSLDVKANITAILKAAKEMNYTGDMAALLAIAKGESGIKGIEEGKVQSAARAAELWAMTQQEAQQLLDSGGWRALYNEVYGWSGNELGNRPGTNDGSDFIGRGFIQITGRHNYKDIGDRIGVDFMSNPELLMDKDIAAKATIAFMQRGGSPKDMESALRAVGGVQEGWPKKRGFYQEFKAMGHPYGGEGDSKPKKSRRKSPVPSISSIPRQQPTRSNVMTQLSTNVVYSNMMKSRGMHKKGSTIIIHKAGSANITHESTHVPRRLNSNKPQTTRRGL